MTVRFLNEADISTIAIKIAGHLDGVPMSQVSAVLDQARDIALSGHLVDVKNERFIELRTSLLEFCRDSDQSA